MLQGLPSYHTLEMPTWGLFISSSDIPVAYSIACDAPCDFGCVIFELYLLGSMGKFLYTLLNVSKREESRHGLSPQQLAHHPEKRGVVWRRHSVFIGQSDDLTVEVF